MDGQLISMTRAATARWSFNIKDPATDANPTGGPGYTQTLSGATVKFTAKRDRTDADVDAVFQKTTGSGVTTIQNGDASTPGIVTVALAQADTSSLPSYDIPLFWDIVVGDSSGHHDTVLSGTLIVTAGATSTP
jgi:hypothetical protein